MSVAFQDYYEILGVPRGSTQAEIQKAYRKMARQFHPDVNKEKGAEDKFKKINEAYEVLKNPESRKKYDQLGSNWRAGEPFSPPRGGAHQEGGFDFSDAFSGSGFSSFFDSLFGNQGKRSASTRNYRYEDEMNAGGVEQEATIEVSLEEALHGVEKEIIVKPLAQASQGEAQRQIKVRIPPGATEGSKIRLKGQGRSRVRGGKPGDLILNVKLKSHPKFHAEKHDIIAKLVVTPWEAALGAKISVATLSRPVTVTIPPGSQSGQRLRLKGKGLPRQKGEAGDIFYEISIATPKTMTEQEQHLFEELSRVSSFRPRD